MSFVAKFGGQDCESCEDSITPGQEVEYTYNRRLVHVVCPEALEALMLARPVCPTCFLELPSTGVCDDCS